MQRNVFADIRFLSDVLCVGRNCKQICVPNNVQNLNNISLLNQVCKQPQRDRVCISKLSWFFVTYLLLYFDTINF